MLLGVLLLRYEAGGAGVISSCSMGPGGERSVGVTSGFKMVGEVERAKELAAQSLGRTADTGGDSLRLLNPVNKVVLHTKSKLNPSYSSPFISATKPRSSPNVIHPNVLTPNPV